MFFAVLPRLSQKFPGTAKFVQKNFDIISWTCIYKTSKELGHNLETSRANQKMSAFWKKQMKTRQTISVVVVVLYLIVTSAISLFHNEDCPFGTAKTNRTNVLYSNEPCPGCKFSAGFNSTEIDYDPALVGAEKPLICQPSQHLAINVRHEWAYSILLRGPPLTPIS